MALFEGSPAYRSGIRRGDVTARIEGKVEEKDETGKTVTKTVMMDTKNWTSEQAVKKLKGPKGTKVSISIRRPGYDKLIDMDVERDEVNIVTVRGAFMLDPQTGYIKLGGFSETSDKEVGDALQKLKAQGMKRLGFDLRDNPGGPLDQAIRIANRFLSRGDMIVYTRGRVANADQDYRGTDDPDFTGPMLVLTNRNSASASEIVSGSLQDHDRALVVGETTFGKALVQSVYKISEGAGLALTTDRYFTPSGRMSVASAGKKRLARGYVVDDALIAAFKASLQAEKVKVDEQAFAKDLEFIKAMIHYDIDVALFGVSEAQTNLIAKDPQAQFALAQFGEAVKLTELARNKGATKGGH